MRGEFRMGIHAGARMQWLSENHPEVIEELKKVQHRMAYKAKLWERSI